MNPLYEQMKTSVFERMSRPRRQAWRRQPRAGLSRFRLARGNPRGGGAGAEGRLEPICAVARDRPRCAKRSRRITSVISDRSSTADHVCVTSGATEALGAAILATVEPGDEVIIFTPAYDSYAPMIRRAGGIAGRGRAAAARMADRSRGARSARSAPKTRAILFNNPHNPTGRLFDADELEVVASVAREHDLIVISDEVWEHIVLDGGTLHAACDASGHGRADDQDRLGRQDLLADRLEGRLDGRRARARRGRRPRAPVPDLLDRAQSPGRGRVRTERGRRLARADARPLRACARPDDRRAAAAPAIAVLDAAATYFLCVDLEASGIAVDDESFAIGRGRAGRASPSFRFPPSPSAIRRATSSACASARRTRRSTPASPRWQRRRSCSA